MNRFSYISFVFYLAFFGTASISYAQETMHTLRGAIGEGEAALQGIQVVLSGARSDTSTTDMNGEFEFIDLPNGEYTLTPVSDQYTFEPEQHTLSLLPGGSNVLPVFNATTATSIDELPDGLHSPALFPNAPNPFTHQTALRYRIASPGEAQLAVYDMLGRNVSTLRQGFHEPGLYEVEFTPDDLPAGIYFFRLETNQELLTRSMILVR